MQKRGISPLIATVLIIGFTVALAAIFMTWGGSFTKSTLETTEKQTQKSMICTSDVGLDIKEVKVLGDKINLLIENIGKEDIANITVMIYGSDGSNSTEIPGLVVFSMQSFEVEYDPIKTGLVEKVKVFPSIILGNEKVVCSNSYDEEERICRSPKILIVDDKYDNYGNIIENELINQGFDVTQDTSITTLNELEGYDIIASFGYVWSVGKGSLLKDAYDAGYSIFSQGNDAYTGNIYPITGHVYSGSIVWTMNKDPSCNHIICEGWSQVVSSSDTGNVITSVVPEAQILGRFYYDNTKIALIYLEKGNGKWVHLQPHVNINTEERNKLFNNIIKSLSVDIC